MLSNLIKSWQLYFALTARSDKALRAFARKNGAAFYFLAPERAGKPSDFPFCAKAESIKQIEKESGRVINELFKSIDDEICETDFVSCGRYGITTDGEPVKIYTLNPQIFDSARRTLAFLSYIARKKRFSSYLSRIDELTERINDCADFRITSASLGHQVDWQRTGKTFLTVYKNTPAPQAETFFGNNFDRKGYSAITSPFLTKEKIRRLIASDSGRRYEGKRINKSGKWLTFIVILAALALTVLFK